MHWLENPSAQSLTFSPLNGSRFHWAQWTGVDCTSNPWQDSPSQCTRGSNSCSALRGGCVCHTHEWPHCRHAKRSAVRWRSSSAWHGSWLSNERSHDRWAHPRINRSRQKMKSARESSASLCLSAPRLATPLICCRFHHVMFLKNERKKNELIPYPNRFLVHHY